jgi:hypothetical protein
MFLEKYIAKLIYNIIKSKTKNNFCHRSQINSYIKVELFFIWVSILYETL